MKLIYPPFPTKKKPRKKELISFRFVLLQSFKCSEAFFWLKCGFQVTLQQPSLPFSPENKYDKYIFFYSTCFGKIIAYTYS